MQILGPYCRGTESDTLVVKPSNRSPNRPGVSDDYSSLRATVLVKMNSKDTPATLKLKDKPHHQFSSQHLYLLMVNSHATFQVREV